MKAFALIMAVVALTLLSIGFTLNSKSEFMRLVCFDHTGKYKISVRGENVRFEGDVIRSTNKDGEYAIYPVPGALCSIVAESKE